MLNVRFGYITGSSLTYAIERMVDGLFLDFADNTFKGRAAATKLLGQMTEETSPFGGLFVISIPDSITTTWADGDYCVRVVDTARYTTVPLAATMSAGQDSPAKPTGLTIGPIKLALT